MVHRRRRQRQEPGAVVGLIPRPRPGGGRVERARQRGPRGAHGAGTERPWLCRAWPSLGRVAGRPGCAGAGRERWPGSSRASPARRSRRRALPRRPRTDRCRSPDTIAQRVQACTPCHGREARTTHEGVFPRIGGKAARYVDTPQRIAGDERRPAADAELVRAGAERRARGRRRRLGCGRRRGIAQDRLHGAGVGAGTDGRGGLPQHAVRGRRRPARDGGGMPPFGPELDDARIAAVATGVRATWGNAGVTGVAAAGGALPPATHGARRSSPRRQCSGSKESA